MTEHIMYGLFGEHKAQKFLKQCGYKILDINFVTCIGEIDIIALETKKVRVKKNLIMSKEIMKEDVIVFIEVKSRNNYKDFAPSEAVDKIKQNKYYEMALLYKRIKKLPNIQYRFDIIEVFGKDKINHIENAF